jgi:hypothetical protein
VALLGDPLESPNLRRRLTDIVERLGGRQRGALPELTGH